MLVTNKMLDAACLAINERGKGNNVTIPDVDTMLQAALAAEFGSEEKPRYTTHRLREEIRKAEERGRQQEREAASAAAAPSGDPLELPYKNWRGEVSTRRIQPIRIEFAATEWHPEPQWLLVATDIEKQAERSFALKDFNPPPSVPVAWYWEDATGCFHITLDRADVFEMAKTLGCIPKPLFGDPGDPSRFFDQPALSVAEASLQYRVQPWMMACFGPEIAADRLERADRLLEEVFELLQSGNYPRERIRALEEYTFSREKGEPMQEVGGVMITLAAYCLAHDLDMHLAGEAELARIWTKVEKIRAKQAAKPTGSALPVAVLPPSGSNVENEITSIVQSVNEWDDRTSPDDYPEHLLITSEELTLILRDFATTLGRSDSPAIRAIAAERRRQIESEGWTPEHDDAHTDFSLAKAACVYTAGATLAGPDRAVMDNFGGAGTPAWMKDLWPWDISWWKPKDRQRDLEKAGALLVAELDRLIRAAASISKHDNHGTQDMVTPAPTKPPKTSDEILSLIDRAKALDAAMSTEDREAMYAAQRESFVRGMATPCEHGAIDFEQCEECRKGGDA